MKQQQPVELYVLDGQRAAVDKRGPNRRFLWPSARAESLRHQRQRAKLIIGPEDRRRVTKRRVTGIRCPVPEIGKGTAQPHRDVTTLAGPVIVAKQVGILEHRSAHVRQFIGNLSAILICLRLGGSNPHRRHAGKRRQRVEDQAGQRFLEVEMP